MDVRNDEHPSQVLRELNSQRERGELTDVVLEVGGRSFPCHRAVLASCSPYFHGMFTSGYAEAKQERISIKEMTEVAMATILDYAYTSRLQTDPDQVQDVMSAASLLQVDFVYRKAAEYMKDKLDMINCADVLMYADMLGARGLVKASKRYIASRFHQVALQPSFLQLPLPLLQSLLDRDDLLTYSEDDVVQAVLRWIDFEQEGRLQQIPKLCHSLRHFFVSSNRLVDLERKCSSTDLRRLVYSNSTTERLGRTQTEMQIFLRELFSDFDSPESPRSAPCYDPSTGGLYSINMPHSLDRFSVTVTPDDELYLAGGVATSRESGSTHGRTGQKAFYHYNHLFSIWEPRCEMIAQRVRCGLVYLKGYIYAIGGDNTKETAERYDPSCDEWTSIPPLPHPVSPELCTVTLNDSIYVISGKGCYCFSTTENTWRKIADMLEPPLRPQAVTHRGRIYCIDCDRGESTLTCLEMYNPANNKWTITGHGSLTFNVATLIKYRGDIYILTVVQKHRLNVLDAEETRVDAYQYQSKTGSWRHLKDSSRLVPPMVEWLCSGSVTYCLTARMVPQCLGDACDFQDELMSDFSFTDSESSGVSDDDDSEDDLSDQDDSDEDNNDDD
ncbi:kelch repeat and BTB domain-containing protein 8-like [Branchiostoma lanceolatum]|uniref:kelch repeat and BTB domain-containing protein 8-like n=1 Tax=Branchiostoma lanceolatum TaxID=7740 RepID=UPI003452F3F1